jgi:hypothetical protein
MRGSLLGWSCVSDVVDGKVTGSAYYNLGAKGEPTQDGHDWEWRVTERDFRVSLMKWFREDQIELFVDIPGRLLKERLSIELRPGVESGPQSDPSLAARGLHRWQYNFSLTRPQVQHVASSGEALNVVVIDANEQVIQSVKVDTSALARGEAAMASARERANEMKLDYRNKCSPIYERNEGLVIT